MLQLIATLPPPWNEAVAAALLGDAFGVPHEFKQGYETPVKRDLAMVLPAQYPKSYAWVHYGTWSDDGSQMLALLDALQLRAGHYDATTFGANLLSWLHDAKYQAGGSVFDCGMQTRLALDSLAKGTRFTLEGSHCGNGSLMRVLPMAAMPEIYPISKDEALRAAMLQSDVTHPQPVARICCALYVLLAWAAQTGHKSLRAALPSAGEHLRSSGLLNAEEHLALKYVLGYGATHMPNNSGFVVNSLWSALWAVERSDSLSDTLKNVVAAGGDTDTVACIAGGLASLVFGWDSTALAWRQQMNWTTAPASLEPGE